jgi:hypothetical protein
MTANTIQQTTLLHRAPRRASAGSSAGGRIVELAARVAAALIAGALLVATLTDVAFAAAARGWLGYRFPGVPARAGEAALIFEHNLVALLGVLGVLLIAQIAARAADGPGPLQRAVQVCAELSLAAGIAANTLIVGIAIGAYGLRMVHAVLPHWPVELAA